jgi:hypothetical protein
MAELNLEEPEGERPSQPHEEPPVAGAPDEAPALPDAAALLGSVEPLVQQNRWDEIVTTLGPSARAEKLPPALALIYAMALAETAGSRSTSDANLIAIRSVATLLAVPTESSTALMVAKRVMRRNPIAWRRRPAPRAPIRMALVIVALALGIVSGWLVGPSGIRLQEILEAVFP